MITWVVCYLPLWSVFPLNKFINFLRSFCVPYILWHIKWFVDDTLIDNVQPRKFHNRQNKVRVKRRRSVLPLFCCQTITTTRRILMKMRTPVTAFQMTSLHWQRSVSVSRTMNEKLKLNQLVYIGAEGHCLCCFKYQQHSIIHLLSFKTIKSAFWKSLQSSHFRALTSQAPCISENTCFQGSMSGFISQDLVTDVDFLSVFYSILCFLEFDRPVSGNIGNYDIICSLYQTSSISFYADQSILMRAREKRSLS